MEAFPGHDSLFRGSLFVFDERISVLSAAGNAASSALGTPQPFGHSLTALEESAACTVPLFHLSRAEQQTAASVFNVALGNSGHALQHQVLFDSYEQCLGRYLYFTFVALGVAASPSWLRAAISVAALMPRTRGAPGPLPALQRALRGLLTAPPLRLLPAARARLPVMPA